MKRLPPLLSYYGSKYTLAPRYPHPQHRQIIEPFAGGASYSLCHAEHDVLLVDKYEKLIAVWQYLIAASPSEILSIPLLGHDETVDDLAVCQEARWLVGWWLNIAVASPRKRMSKWGRVPDARTGKPRVRVEMWGERCRERIASTVPHIKHWRAVCADYANLDIAQPATWFVDPPYQLAGKHYVHGSKGIDFAALGAWCASLSGQVLVCENAGASWLPFQPFAVGASSRNYDARKSVEVLWTNDGLRMPQAQSLPLGAVVRAGGGR